MAIFQNGLVIGRFQLFHSGHEQIVRTALACCERVLLFIGSSQEQLTATNPFSYELRCEVITRVFTDEVASGRLILEPLPDLGVGGNQTVWGDYLLSAAKRILGVQPDLLVSGTEGRRVTWFEREYGRIAELYVPKTVDISGSAMRTFMIDNEEALWRAYTNPLLWDMYERLRAVVLLSKDNTETASV